MNVVVHAAQTPITIEGYTGFNGIADVDGFIEDSVGSVFSTLGLSDPELYERNTCDPEFMEVLEARAWLEGQREVTQNANLVPRPDSVLSLSCFDRYLDHLAYHSARNFPGDPDYSDGSAGGALTNLSMDYIIDMRLTWPLDFEFDFFNWASTFSPGYETLLNADDSAGISGIDGGDPWLTNGFEMYALLEILVLDHLVEDVTDLGSVLDVVSLGGAACAAADLSSGVDPGDIRFPKDYYIQDNFPLRLLGDRARDETTAPTQDELFSWAGTLNAAPPLDDYEYANNVRERQYQTAPVCDMMNRLWQRAKCYDFATESSLDIHPVPTAPNIPVPPTVPVEEDHNHDGFYTLEQYRDAAELGRDYRLHASQCAAPDGNIIPEDVRLVLNITTDASGNVDFDLPSDWGSASDEWVCRIGQHGIPSFSLFSSHPRALYLGPLLWSAASEYGLGNDIADFLVGVPTWDDAYTDANPLPSEDGALDEYTHFLELRDRFVCADPIQTGYIVSRTGDVPYIDAVCPTPGCWFNPPATMSALGTCENN